MRNILGEKPTDPLHGRLAFSAAWVAPEDLADRRVLDVGCGYGWFEQYALGCGTRFVVGTERSESDLETARTHIADPRVDFRTGDALAIPFEDATFDTVVSWEVIEHVPKGTEPRMFAEVRRVLRPGGHFYLSTPHRTPLANVTDPAWWLVGHRHYGVEQVRAFAENGGFDVVEITLRAGHWYILASLDMYVSKWLLRRAPVLSRLTRPAQEREFARDGFAMLFAKLRARRPYQRSSSA